MQSRDGNPVIAINHRLLNASVMWTFFYGCESWKLTEQARRKLNGTVSKTLLRNTGRTVADEPREQTLVVMMRARDRRWNWLGRRCSRPR